MGFGTGKKGGKKVEQMWMCPFLFLVFPPCLLSDPALMCIGESWAQRYHYLHYDYHMLQLTRGPKTARPWSKVVMESEFIACCFSVPSVANHFQPRWKWQFWSALYTMHRFLKVFADRILLIIMKRITLFWIVFSYFLYSGWMASTTLSVLS